MKKRPYLWNILALALATIVLGTILHVAAGPRWFSFFGVATLALISLPILGFILFRRYRQLSFRRWPIVAILLPAVIAALVQIGFWIAFFESGSNGVMLAAGRSMVLPLIEPYLPYAAGVLALLTAWLIARGAMKRES